MQDSKQQSVESNRIPGVCAVCNRERKILTEVEIGDGFIQICDRDRPAVIEGLSRDE